ncbi:hypothetical protein L218DRAFT_988982 [Marasmius fiardii PR-910]|nr:hypothetical protein L218DRAFT_988982 [Marasmius fiardii PR-910]
MVQNRCNTRPICFDISTLSMSQRTTGRFDSDINLSASRIKVLSLVNDFRINSRIQVKCYFRWSVIISGLPRSFSNTWWGFGRHAFAPQLFSRYFPNFIIDPKSSFIVESKSNFLATLSHSCPIYFFKGSNHWRRCWGHSRSHYYFDPGDSVVEETPKKRARVR